MLKKKKEQLELPEHVVLSILCRLPIRSLIRFTLVSKRWRSLIVADVQFADSHLQLASHRRQNLLTATHPALLPSQFHFLDDNFSSRKLTCPSEPNSDIVLMGSCNGLVVSGKFQYSCEHLGHFDYLKNFVMWNPSTGFFRRIPSPSLRIGILKLADEEKTSFVHRIYHGCGQVSNSDDYKLVVIPKFYDFMEVRVFSVRANCWKLVKGLYFSAYPLWYDERGTYLNGAIHWISTGKPGIFDPFLLPTIVDPEKEEVYYLDPLRRRLPPIGQEWVPLVSAITKYTIHKGMEAKEVKKPWKALLGVPPQPDVIQCGYFIMRYIRDFVKDKDLSLFSKVTSKG